MLSLTTIPEAWLESWKQLGATVSKGDGLSVIYLTESLEAVTDFMVKMSEYDIDPLIVPHYGLQQYSLLQVQAEVNNILGSHQPLLEADFVAGPIAVTPQVLPAGGWVALSPR